MSPTDKFASLAAALLAAGIFLSGVASAQDPCPAGQSVNDFLSSPCRSQSTLFTENPASAANRASATNTSVQAANGATAPGGGYKLAYSVSMANDPATTTIDTAMQQSLEEVALDVSETSVQAGDGRLVVSTQLFADGFDKSAPLANLESVNGEPGGSGSCGPACGSTLYVIDNVKVESRGVGLSGLTNPFMQTRQPIGIAQIGRPIKISSPGTLGIFGLGLAGLGVARIHRRKRTA